MSGTNANGPNVLTVADHDRLDLERLAGWMAANVDGFAGPLGYVRFAGGQSNPTYRLDTPDRAYVLRRKPFGPILPSAHAVEREYRVIAGLHPTGFPVPRPYGLCEDDAVIGSSFYVMEMVEGRTLWDGTLPGMGRDDRTNHYHAVVDALAALHNVDFTAAGLDDHGRPGNYFERQVARWTKQYRAAETELLGPVERLIDWLPRTVPEQTRTSIVHGDFRIDNMIFATERAQVAAVLDWELSTLGDPLADFTYLLMGWVTDPDGRSGVMGATGPLSGIPKINEIVTRYCAATRRDGVPALEWYFAYNFFRLIGIVQGIKKRMQIGTASNLQAAQTVARLDGLVDAAWGFAVKAGA